MAITLFTAIRSGLSSLVFAAYLTKCYNNIVKEGCWRRTGSPCRCRTARRGRRVWRRAARKPCTTARVCGGSACASMPHRTRLSQRHTPHTSVPRERIQETLSKMPTCLRGRWPRRQKSARCSAAAAAAARQTHPINYKKTPGCTLLDRGREPAATMSHF